MTTTPRPFEEEERSRPTWSYRSGGVVVVEPGRSVGGFMEWEARLVVRAVNTFDEAKAVINEAYCICLGWDDGLDSEFTPLCKQLKAVLARMEGIP